MSTTCTETVAKSDRSTDELSEWQQMSLLYGKWHYSIVTYMSNIDMIDLYCIQTLCCQAFRRLSGDYQYCRNFTFITQMAHPPINITPFITQNILLLFDARSVLAQPQDRQKANLNSVTFQCVQRTCGQMVIFLVRANGKSDASNGFLRFM